MPPETFGAYIVLRSAHSHTYIHTHTDTHVRYMHADLAVLGAIVHHNFSNKKFLQMIISAKLQTRLPNSPKVYFFKLLTE